MKPEQQAGLFPAFLVKIDRRLPVKERLETLERAGQNGRLGDRFPATGHAVSPNRTVSFATRHMLEALKAMAVGLTLRNIRVNSIGPTFADTPLVRRVVDAPEKRDFIMPRIPLGRRATLGGIALPCVPGGCDGDWNAHLIFDGGWTAQ